MDVLEFLRVANHDMKTFSLSLYLHFPIENMSETAASYSPIFPLKYKGLLRFIAEDS